MVISVYFDNGFGLFFTKTVIFDGNLRILLVTMSTMVKIVSERLKEPTKVRDGHFSV